MNSAKIVYLGIHENTTDELGEQSFSIQLNNEIVNTIDVSDGYLLSDFLSVLNQGIKYHNINHSETAFEFRQTTGFPSLPLSGEGDSRDYTNNSDLKKSENFLVAQDFTNNVILSPDINVIGGNGLKNIELKSDENYTSGEYTTTNSNTQSGTGFKINLNINNSIITDVVSIVNTGIDYSATNILTIDNLKDKDNNDITLFVYEVNLGAITSPNLKSLKSDSSLSFKNLALEQIANGTYEFSFSGGSGSGAKVELIISNNKIENVTSFTLGQGYMPYEILTLNTIKKSDGSDITLTVTEVTQGIKHMDLLDLDNLQTGPVNKITNINSGNTSITEDGNNVSCSGGTGTGCIINFTVSDGVIVSTTLINRGSGYSDSDILTIGQTGATFVVDNSHSLYNLKLYKGEVNSKNARLNNRLTLKYNEDKTLDKSLTQIFKNKYYMDFPMNTSSPELPNSLLKDLLLCNCMVIGFTLTKIKDYFVKTLEFTIENNTNLRMIAKINSINNQITVDFSMDSDISENNLIYADSKEVNKIKITFNSELIENDIIEDDNKIFGRLYIGLQSVNANTNDNSKELFDLKVKITSSSQADDTSEIIDFKYGILYP